RAMDGLGYDAVVLDNHRAAYEATAHITGHGHRRIALINGPEIVRTAADRLQGYREALLAAGLGFDQALVRDADFQEQAAYDAAVDLLR
ncbi:substrate-binding domain-containing protein, partial [Acinetobacter baumannii]